MLKGKKHYVGAMLTCVIPVSKQERAIVRRIRRDHGSGPYPALAVRKSASEASLQQVLIALDSQSWFDSQLFL